MRLQVKTLNNKLDEAQNQLAEKIDILEVKEKDNNYLKSLAEKTQAVQIDSCEDATKKVLVAKKTMENLQVMKAESCSGIIDMPSYLEDPAKHFTVEEGIKWDMQAIRKP